MSPSLFVSLAVLAGGGAGSLSVIIGRRCRRFRHSTLPLVNLTRYERYLPMLTTTPFLSHNRVDVSWT
jgi:hypothetical protein